MNDHVYKTVEITGTSESGIDDAVRRAIGKASQTLRNIDWFEVDRIRGHVENGTVGHVQVTVKIGFRLE